MEVNEYKAKCGHVDLLGYFANTYCRKCADKGYESVTGNKPKRRKYAKR